MQDRGDIVISLRKSESKESMIIYPAPRVLSAGALLLIFLLPATSPVGIGQIAAAKNGQSIADSLARDQVLTQPWQGWVRSQRITVRKNTVEIRPHNLAVTKSYKWGKKGSPNRGRSYTDVGKVGAGCDASKTRQNTLGYQLCVKNGHE